MRAVKDGLTAPLKGEWGKMRRAGRVTCLGLLCPRNARPGKAARSGIPKQIILSLREGNRAWKDHWEGWGLFYARSEGQQIQPSLAPLLRFETQGVVLAA